MAIIARAIYGDPIQLKEDETIQVRLVDVSSDRNGTVTMRVDVRTYVENDRYTGWTKNGLQTDDPQVLRDLAATLLSAADDAEQKGMHPANGTSVPTVPTVPTVPVNTNSPAAKKYLARKATAAGTSPVTGRSRAPRKSTK